VKRMVAMAAIALSITTAAQAENNTIMFAKNYWRVTHVARNSSGNPVCMMQSQISFTDGPTGFVFIMSTKAKLNVYLTKTNWQFTSDVQVPFSVNLDSGRRELFGVSKKSANSKFDGIIASASKDEIDGDWLEDFASSRTMTITFRSGNEPQWSVKMAGSRGATNSFRSCIKLLGKTETSDPQATSPVPEDPDTPFPGPTKPVPTVPIKKPKGDSI
jgi:hypothetical protein